MEESMSSDGWRVVKRPDFELAALLSKAVATETAIENNIPSLRGSPTLLMFSDYGGAHKGARYEVLSYLVTTLDGLTNFNPMRVRLRENKLGSQRRMSYKALNDNIRRQSLPAYLKVVDLLDGVLISFAIDKRAAPRLSESYQSETAFGTLSPWANRSFGKLSRIGHLGAIVIEGLHADHQNLIWITDEDEIAPNPDKHAEATEFIGHLVNAYLTGDVGRLRFGTTASDSGDLLIEDLTAVPDLAAGGLNEILTQIAPHPESYSVRRLFIPPNSSSPTKVLDIATWLGRFSSTFTKVNVVVDEGPGGCAVRNFTVVTNLDDL